MTRVHRWKFYRQRQFSLEVLAPFWFILTLRLTFIVLLCLARGRARAFLSWFQRRTTLASALRSIQFWNWAANASFPSFDSANLTRLRFSLFLLSTIRLRRYIEGPLNQFLSQQSHSTTQSLLFQPTVCLAHIRSRRFPLNSDCSAPHTSQICPLKWTYGHIFCRLAPFWQWPGCR